MLGVVMGSGIIYYGDRAYTLTLTQDPFETLLLYLGFAAPAVLAYPATFFVDGFVLGPRQAETQPIPSPAPPAFPRMWSAMLGLFLLIVVLAEVAAMHLGFRTARTHLESPPWAHVASECDPGRCRR